jgi:ArsR family transcriptional regulator
MRENRIDIKSGAKLFKAIGDTNRIRILKMLQCCKMCVCEITYVMNLAPSTVSKHLSILRESHFILDEKVGKWVNYQINKKAPPEVRKILSLINELGKSDRQVIKDLKVLKNTNRKKICNI